MSFYFNRYTLGHDTTFKLYYYFCFLATVAVNKCKLVESGCLDVILPLLTNQSPFVQFKVLGTLRMLLMGHGKNLKQSRDSLSFLLSKSSRISFVLF